MLKFLIIFCLLSFSFCDVIYTGDLLNLSAESISHMTETQLAELDWETLCQIVTSEMVGPAIIVRAVSSTVGKTWSTYDFASCLQEKVQDTSKMSVNLRIAAPEFLESIPIKKFYNSNFFHKYAGILTEGLNGNIAEQGNWRVKSGLSQFYLDVVPHTKLVRDSNLCHVVFDAIKNDFSVSFWRLSGKTSSWKLFACMSTETIESKHFEMLPVLDHRDLQTSTWSKFGLAKRVFSDNRIVKELDFFRNYSYLLDSTWSSDFLLNVFSAKTDVLTVQQITAKSENFIIFQNIESGLVKYSRIPNLFLAQPNWSLHSEIKIALRSTFNKPEEFRKMVIQLNQIRLIRTKQLLIADLISEKIKFDSQKDSFYDYLEFLGPNVDAIPFENIQKLSTQDAKVISFFILQAQNLNQVQKFIHAQKTQTLIGDSNLLKNLFNFGPEYVDVFGLFKFRVSDLMSALAQQYSSEKGFQKVDFFSKELAAINLTPTSKRFILDYTKNFVINTNTSKTISGFENIISVNDIENIKPNELLNVLAVLDKSKLPPKVVEQFAKMIINLQGMSGIQDIDQKPNLEKFSKSELRLIGGEILSQVDVEKWSSVEKGRCLYIVQLIGQNDNVCRTTDEKQRRAIVTQLINKCNLSEDEKKPHNLMRLLGNLIADYIGATDFVDHKYITDNINFLEKSCWTYENGKILRNRIFTENIFSKIEWPKVILSLNTQFYNLLEQESEIRSLTDLAKTDPRLRESLFHLSRRTPTNLREEKFHKILVSSLISELLPSYESRSTCWRIEQRNELTCHKLRALGDSIKFVNQSELRNMNECELRRCLEFITNNKFSTEPQLKVLLEKFKSFEHWKNEFISKRQQVALFGRSLTYMNSEDFQRLNLDFSDRNILFQLGRIDNWNKNRLAEITTRVKIETGLQVNALTALDVKTLGNIICGFNVEELLCFRPDIIKQTIQDLG